MAIEAGYFLPGDPLDSSVLAEKQSLTLNQEPQMLNAARLVLMLACKLCCRAGHAVVAPLAAL